MTTSHANAIIAAQPPTIVGDVGGFYVRPGLLSDLTVVDQIQKMFGHELGFQYLAKYEKAVANGNELYLVCDQNGLPFGFILGQDRYRGRDDVGIIYQLAVVPAKRRAKLGAMLVRTFVAGCSRGTRLLCCWCAQDLPANRFWEAIGGVPLAFRTGSKRSQRVHIFWQMRTRRDDTSTPWWYPFQTSGGAVREDRLVLPLPPDRHWSDPVPVVLPGLQSGGNREVAANGLPPPPAKTAKAAALPAAPMSAAERAAEQRRRMTGQPKGTIRVMTPSGPRYLMTEAAALEAQLPKQAKPKVPRVKNDPEHVKAARELAAAYVEAASEFKLLPAAHRYDITREVAPVAVDLSRMLGGGGDDRPRLLP